MKWVVIVLGKSICSAMISHFWLKFKTKFCNSWHWLKWKQENESPSCNYWTLKEMFGKVNRSFRTLNDCDMLCSGDAKCWHHVCSLFVTLLAQLAWWTIDYRTRHSGCQSAPGVQVLGSLSRSWEQRRRVGGIVSGLVFHLQLWLPAPLCFLRFIPLYFLFNKINNSGKRLLWLVKVFLKESGH